MLGGLPCNPMAPGGAPLPFLSLTAPDSNTASFRARSRGMFRHSSPAAGGMWRATGLPSSSGTPRTATGPRRRFRQRCGPRCPAQSAGGKLMPRHPVNPSPRVAPANAAARRHSQRGRRGWHRAPPNAGGRPDAAGSDFCGMWPSFAGASAGILRRGERSAQSCEARHARSRMADGVGFEPTRRRRLPVFKTGAFNRSATHPVQPGRRSGLPGGRDGNRRPPAW